MPKHCTAADVPLRPCSSRLPGRARPATLRLPPPRRKPRTASRSSGTGWQRRFLRGFAEGGLQAGLAQSGIGLGDAVIACLAHPEFRLQIDRTSAERLAAAEHLLVDLLLERLHSPTEGVEKSVLAIWQLLTDEKRRPAARADAPRPAQRRPRHSISPERAEAAARSNARAGEFRQVLDVVRARLAEIERSKAAANGGRTLSTEARSPAPAPDHKASGD